MTANMRAKRMKDANAYITPRPTSWGQMKGGIVRIFVTEDNVAGLALESREVPSHSSTWLSAIRVFALVKTSTNLETQSFSRSQITFLSNGPP